MTLHFIRPLWFFSMIPCGFFLWRLWSRRKSYNPWQQVCDRELFMAMYHHTHHHPRLWPFYAIAMALCITCISLAGPAWRQLPQRVYHNEQPLVLLLDTSIDMLGTDLKPHRLQRAKYKINDLLETRSDGQTALVAFAGEAYTVSPLTQDKSTLLNFLPELDPTIMPISGNHIKSALQQGIQLLQQANFHEGRLLLMTAGYPTKADISFAHTLKQQGYALDVMAMGTPGNGSPIIEQHGRYLKDKNGHIILTKIAEKDLKDLAQAGGGRFQWFTHNNQDIDNLLVNLQPSHNAIETHDALRWQDEGRYGAFLLLPFALFAFRQGWLGALLA